MTGPGHKEIDSSRRVFEVQAMLLVPLTAILVFEEGTTVTILESMPIAMVNA